MKWMFSLCHCNYVLFCCATIPLSYFPIINSFLMGSIIFSPDLIDQDVEILFDFKDGVRLSERYLWYE
jgi:hypothetical protein